MQNIFIKRNVSFKDIYINHVFFSWLLMRIFTIQTLMRVLQAASIQVRKKKQVKQMWPCILLYTHLMVMVRIQTG